METAHMLNETETGARESEARFMPVPEDSLEATYRRNLHSDRYDYISSEIEKLIGYTPDEMSAMSIDDLFQHVHPDDRERTAQKIERVLRDGRGVLEYRFRTKDGDYRWLADSVSVFAHEEGPPSYYIGIVQDVTDRKQIEETLQRQTKELEAASAEARNERSRLEAVMEALPVGVSITDISGGVLRVNRAFKELWGGEIPPTRSVKDYETFKAWRLDTGEPLPPGGWASAQAVQKGETVTGQLLEIQRFDGKRIPVINSASPVYGPGGDIVGSAVAIQDITGLRKMETALQRTRFRFELLSKTASLLLVSPDPEGSVHEICLEVMAHLDCQVFFNFLADQQTGRLRLNAYSGIPEEEARRIEWLDYGVAVCGCVARDKSPLIAHDIFRTPDVRTELVKSYGVRAYACHPILSQGRLMGTLSFGTKNRSFFSSDDITLMKTITDQVATAMERAGLIRQLKDSRDQMEARVRERTAELEARNQELQEFSYVASHDLQEPLRKIVTFGDMLVSGAGDSLDDESRDCVERMQKSAGIMRMLLESLLRYSRVTTKPAPFETMDLRAPIEAALSNLEVMMREKGAHVEVADLPTIEADPAQMIQLFQNIIANALKFCPDGCSPSVRIYASEPQKEDGRKDRVHRICVEDNGIGFDEIHLDKIFSPFQRLHGKIKYQGVGMGLAICKKIVDRHGGKITARSERRQRYHFHHHLTCGGGRRKMNSRDKRCQASPMILMAEDDPDDRFLMARAFRELGLDTELRFVGDGEELMRYLHGERNPADSGVAFLARSALSGSEYAQEGRQGGPQGNQGKPDFPGIAHRGVDHLPS